jgi:dipeptidyl aminopeptidase/acylaminoacyl peptidase
MIKKILIVTLAALIFSIPVLANKSVMSLKQTVELRAVSSSFISPDGKLIAYTLNVPRETYKAEDGKAYSELYVTSVNADTRKFITGKVNVSSISWSHDSQTIYYIAKRFDDKFNSVYKISVNGGESEKVVSIKSDIKAFSVNSDNNRLVYLAEPVKDKSVAKLKKKGFMAKVYEESKKKTGAYLVDLNNEDKKHQKLNLTDNPLSIAFNPKDSSQLLMRVAPSALIDDNYTASQYKIFSTKGKLIKSFKTEGKLGMAQWSDDGKHVAMIGAENENDPAAGRLFVANVNSGKVTEPVKNYLAHVKDLEWLSGHQLAFLGHVGTKSEVSIFNLDSQSVTNKVMPGEALIRSIDADSSGQKLIAMASSSKHPREVFDLSSGKAKRLTNSNVWLNDIKMPKQQSITYNARDGVELEGILVYPIGYKKNKRYPLIMMVHGGPESHISDEWLDKYSYPIKHAAGNGFAVFLPNYRGSTGRGVEFSKMGQADYAGAEFNDLVDAITHLSKIGLVDKKRVGITGGSYGGYASAWAATALSEHFAASVMFVGISNQLSKFGTTDIPKEMYNVHARNYPWDKWQWMLERSPIYHTDKAKTPILIMHGEKDTRVHPSQSMELYRYIKTRTKTPARLVFYPDEPHGNQKAGAQLDYSMRLMRWMNFYLKGKNKADKIPPYELDHKSKLESSKED